jgi:hypothetical protein
MENQTYQEVVKFRGDEIVAVLRYEELSDNPEVEDAFSDGKDYVVVFADSTQVSFRIYDTHLTKQQSAALESKAAAIYNRARKLAV